MRRPALFTLILTALMAVDVYANCGCGGGAACEQATLVSVAEEQTSFGKQLKYVTPAAMALVVMAVLVIPAVRLTKRVLRSPLTALRSETC